MSSFPLYDSLVKDLPKKDLSMSQKKELIEKINHIDENGRDLIYALVYFHSMQNSSTDSVDTPYGGVSEKTKKGRENITWTLSDFPIPLRNILYKFVNIHVQSRREDMERALCTGQ